MKDIIAKHNFIFRQVREMPDVDGKLWEMEHAGTGAKLCWLERADENMTFAIGFKTIPTDSTGVFHILEHSVLCGSDKFPVKEPFVELLKSSLQTFLNAMTYNDKTVYPVSSRNKQDFLNLVNVYMDAVLHPAAVSKSEIFRQEGWRYEMGEDGKPFYQGVVYNEMKGSFASVDTVMSEALDQMIYPDNCYRHCSGGNPEAIPDLTYEQFVKAHSTYYHPSNALIILDGQVDLDSVLPLIDSYLAPYERQTLEFPIPMQKALPYQEKEVLYEIGENESAENRVIVAHSKLFADYSDQEELFAADILCDYLVSGSEGPLKRAILSAGLGTDVKLYSYARQQANIVWAVWNTEAEKVPEVKEFIRKTLTEMVEKGLDRERLEACFAHDAFQKMDRDGMGWPRGLAEMDTIYESWLYGGDPAQNLSFRATLDALHEKLHTGYFEEKLRQWLLDDTTGATVIMKPSKGLGAEKLEREHKRVAAEWDAMNAEEQKATADLCDAIRAWQQTPDSEEDLATIPVLKVSDIPETVKKLAYTVDNTGAVPVLHHTTDSKLVSINLLFNASDLTEEELPVASLLTDMLGKLPTAKHDSAALQTVVRQKIGKISYSVLPTATKEDGTEKCSVHAAVRTVCLEQYKEDTAALLTEILNETIYENTSLLLDVLRQNKTNLQMRLIGAGHIYARAHSMAQLTAAAAAAEYLDGCEYISWINQCCEYDEVALKGLLDRMADVAAKIFTRNRLILSVSDNVEPALVETLATAFVEGDAAPASKAYRLLPASREGILIPAGVGFAAKSAHLSHYGKSYTGSVAALANMLGLEHLWNAIRVQGGAYGAHFTATADGNIYFSTYRDPNPARSLGCFDDSARVIREYCEKGSKLDKFILGAVSNNDLPLSAEARVRLAENRYLKGTTHEDVERIHRELLHTSREEIVALCDTLDEIAKSENICVVGGQPQLDGCGEKLTEIRQILA